MTIRPLLHEAIESLRLNRIVFESGLTDEEITRVEAVHRFRFPPDFRLFLQTALPVSGGFPNWRSEANNDLRYHYLDRPSRGLLFDVEHNDFWPDEWGPRPPDLPDALAVAGRHLTEAPTLIPVRSHHFLPASPSTEGNPVFSVRQADIACVGRDLSSYLLNLFEVEKQAQDASSSARVVPFWTELARTSQVRVPNLAGPAVSEMEEEYAGLCRIVKDAGFWAEVIPLLKGSGVTFDRSEPTGDRRQGVFWMERRDFGWLLCVRCPRFYFVPASTRIPELCLALLNGLPSEELIAGHLPFWNFTLANPIRREFGLVAIQHFTNFDDERERKLRAWERLGWREMSHGQMDAVWNEYGERIGYPAGEGFTTPQPSATFDISPIYLRGNEHLEQMEADLTQNTLAALKKCTKANEELYALDWNHPCYFFDPNSLSDASPTSWPVPVLPNGDHYIFLAPDFRFGIIGNCVDMTICVFGWELLAAFDDGEPLIFQWRTWTYEERRAKEGQWADQGWQRLSFEEKEDIWERFDSQFGFYQRRTVLDAPGIAEPTPSLTWAIVSSPACRKAHATDLTLKVLAGFQRATKRGERLIALDALRWYEHYTFDPRRLDSAERDSWALSVLPDDNSSIFLASDFRFGVFGNPLEKTFCVFGQELLEAVADDLPLIFGKVVRKNGKSVSI